MGGVVGMGQVVELVVGVDDGVGQRGGERRREAGGDVAGFGGAEVDRDEGPVGRYWNIVSPIRHSSYLMLK